MFQKILVATDLSEASDHVIGCLHGLKPLGAEEALLVHALGIRYLEDMKDMLAPMVEPRLQAQKALLEAQGFVSRYAIMPGLPGVEVNRAASHEHASMIVIGTRGATLAREVLLGGSALEVLHQARVPVLVMPVSIVEGAGAMRCEVACSEFTKQVLYPTDFSDTAERAFTYVERFVESGTRRVTLLHVQDQVHIGKHLKDRLEEFNRIDRSRLERLRGDLEHKGATNVRIEIPFGSPIQEIVRRAKDADDTVIVMGSQGRGFISEVFLGSVSHQVVRQAPVPVLLIPALR
jgi:nucleotide-binding universal stress UspA family protein